MKATHARALGAGFALLSLALSQNALAARDASSEVGRWIGFGHQAAQLAPGSHVTLDLAAAVGASALSLNGVINGLPAVQMPLNAMGSVTPMGRLTLNLSGEGLVGFCDGSVRVLAGFGRPGEQDMIADLNYRVTDATGAVMRGHVNLIHLYGGLDWANVAGPNLIGSELGSALPAVQDVLVPVGGSIDTEMGSSLGGSLSVGTQQYDLLGTVNTPGSLVMMCDGSVRNADGSISSLIGLLFTGGVRNLSAVGVPAVQHIVGRYGVGGFVELLPAVQRSRPGTLSVLIGL